MHLRNVSLNELSEQAAQELLRPLTKELRLLALSSGWPAEAIKSLTVALDDTYTLYVDYPEDIRETVENLEYGDINGLPNAVIRPFIFRAPKIIEEYIKASMLQELFIETGVI